MQTGTSVGTERGGPTTSPPTVAYLILTHKDPEQVEALASRILALSDTGQVVVHHDLKADPLPWDGSPPARVHLVDRVQVEWGDWSIVEATLTDVPICPRSVGRRRGSWFFRESTGQS